jgi:hypothetical protein
MKRESKLSENTYWERISKNIFDCATSEELSQSSSINNRIIKQNIFLRVINNRCFKRINREWLNLINWVDIRAHVRPQEDLIKEAFLVGWEIS